MKHYITLTLMLSTAFVVVAVPALANDDVEVNANVEVTATSSSGKDSLRDRMEERKQEVEQHMDDVMEHMEERKASTTMSMEDRVSKVERAAEVKMHIEDRKASSTERRLEMQKELAKRKVSFVVDVMNATIERLEKIIDRIESRIAKVQEQGGDTTEVQSFVDTAKNELEDAKVAVQAFANLDFSTDTTAGEDFATARAAAAEAKTHIRTAKEDLLKAVRALKGPNTGVQSDGGVTATSTTE